MQTWQMDGIERLIKEKPYGSEKELQEIAEVFETDAGTVAENTVMWLMNNV